jgi:uncharacterized protein (DUF1499 family)
MRLSWVLLTLLLVPEAAMAALFGDLFAGSAPASLGVHEGRLSPCPDRPNCVSSEAADDAHRVAGFRYAGDGAAALRKLATIIATQEGARIVLQQSSYLHAEYRSRLMGFVDDVEFTLNPATRTIEVRSASRLGYSDLGVNRARVETLRAAFAEVRA